MAGSAENAFQAFLVTEETLLSQGRLSEVKYHSNIGAAHNALLLVRAGQMTFDTFSAQIVALKGGN